VKLGPYRRYYRRFISHPAAPCANRWVNGVAPKD
jgi:hypothetical protein